MVKLEHEIIQFYIYILEIFLICKTKTKLLLDIITLVEESSIEF